MEVSEAVERVKRVIDKLTQPPDKPDEWRDRNALRTLLEERERLREALRTLLRAVHTWNVGIQLINPGPAAGRERAKCEDSLRAAAEEARAALNPTPDPNPAVS